MLTLRLDEGPAGTALDLQLDGWDAVWALRRRMRVPIDHVTAARTVTRDDLATAGLRLGGTYVPGRIRAGRYWWRGVGWSFWFVRRADEVLLIDLKDERHQRMVVEVDDPQRRAAEITRAVATGRVG